MYMYFSTQYQYQNHSKLAHQTTPISEASTSEKSRLEGDPHHRVWSQPDVSSNGLVIA